jgi:DNA-directed RNA polymerase specialized sigma24 family protein
MHSLDDPGGQITELLHNCTQGDEEALRDLVPLVYKELRRLAHYHLQSERPDHTLQSTALVHEAYVRLIGSQPVQFQKVVEMKFFGGLSAPGISQVFGLSRATVDRAWATARVWLRRQMSRTGLP